MVQILTTIFFSAAAVSALGVIVDSFSGHFDEIRLALGLVENRAPAARAARSRLRPAIAMRDFVKAPVGSPQLAAA